MFWLGVDVGGTFTDLVLYDAQKKQVRTAKVPSSTHNQSEGILAGIDKLGLDVRQLERMSHGTTVATNTALELNGANIAVLTTKGHKDVLVTGLGNRLAVYDIKAPPIKPMVKRSSCIEIEERLYADGSVRIPLNETHVREVARSLRGTAVEAVAICFLHSYVNPAHEKRCAEIVTEECPGIVVATSAAVLPEYREYERFSTTALNAFVAPQMKKYLGDLSRNLRSRGLSSPLTIMSSNGGVLPIEDAEALPVLTMLSGPAAGVIAAVHIGEAASQPKLITFDMGGTSTDVCIVNDGGYAMTTAGRVGTLPVKIRQIDIHTVAVGGGSIADYRHGGFLTVGPRSAGSYPGPVAYRRGGTQPTITDANVVLGRLRADRPLGGDLYLDKAGARSAIAILAESVGLETDAMAEGILNIATVSLAAAVKEVTVMKGLDPREFALLPYGGAGPLHAAEVADQLGMDSVVLPPMPGNFSALGLLIADVRRDKVQTQLTVVRSTTAAAIRQKLASLAEQGCNELRSSGFADRDISFAATLDMRYSGQSFELPVSVALDVADLETIEQAFEAVYRSRYNTKSAMPMEIVSFRIAAIGSTSKPQLFDEPAPRTEATPMSVQSTEVYFGGRWRKTAIYSRDSVRGDAVVAGPALIEEDGTTTVVPPGWTAREGKASCLILNKSRS
jgi:N-methylhydantoinase A